MNEVCINAEGTKMWLTDNIPHKFGSVYAPFARSFVEIKDEKLKKAVAKVYGLENWIEGGE